MQGPKFFFAIDVNQCATSVKLYLEQGYFLLGRESLNSKGSKNQQQAVGPYRDLRIGLAKDGDQNREDLLTTGRSIYSLETIANMP